MNDFVLTHAVAWHRRAFINEDKKICRLPFPNWQMAIKKVGCYQMKMFQWRQIQNGTRFIAAWDFQWVS